MRDFDRRQLLRGASMIGGGMAVSAMLPSWAQSATPGLVSTLPTVSGENIALTGVAYRMVCVTWPFLS